MKNRLKTNTKRIVTTRNGVTKHFVTYEHGGQKIKVQVASDFDESVPMLEGLWQANKVDIMYAINVLIKEGFHPDDLVAAAADYVNKARKAPSLVRLLQDATKEYLNDVRETHDYKTWLVYDRALKPFMSFVGHEVCVDQITRLHVSSYFAKFKGAKSTYNSHLRRIKSFANWCVRKGYANDAKAFDAVTSLPIEAKEPEYISVDDMEKLISHLKDPYFSDKLEMVKLFIVLSFFMGIRSAEITYLTSDNIICDEISDADGIRISHAKGASNGRRGRFVPSPTPEIARYLAWVKRRGWFDGFDNMFYKNISKLFEIADVYKPNNVGRHSFITYHVALHCNEAVTVTAAGTSHEMAATHYKGIVTKREAEEYFHRLAPLVCNAVSVGPCA